MSFHFLSKSSRRPPVSGHPAYGCAYFLGVSLSVMFYALRDAANVAGFLSSLFFGAVVHPKRIPPQKKLQTPT